MGKNEGAANARQSQLPFAVSWPIDEDGNPYALVTYQTSELIGLPNYSNVTCGPAAVWRFVKDGKESIANGLKECALATEDIVAEERAIVIESLKRSE